MSIPGVPTHEDTHRQRVDHALREELTNDQLIAELQRRATFAAHSWTARHWKVLEELLEEGPIRSHGTDEV